MSASLKTPGMKSCSVLLNRNIRIDSKAPIAKKIPTLKTKMPEISRRNEIMDSDISPSESGGARIKKKVSYSEDKNTENESSLSDSHDDHSSDEDETDQKQKETEVKRSPKKLICVFCEKSFKLYSSYLSHKRSHSSKPFKCILCHKGFENRQTFINHMKMLHPEMKPFICDYPRCQKNFKMKKELEMHRKMHWKYMCRFCKKLFLRKQHMRKHVLKIH